MSDRPRNYRIYAYDGVHKIVSADWLDASNDEEAIARAEAIDFGTKCEVWHGDRLVAGLEAHRRQA